MSALGEAVAFLARHAWHAALQQNLNLSGRRSVAVLQVANRYRITAL
jgi:hypothetical protein